MHCNSLVRLCCDAISLMQDEQQDEQAESEAPSGADSDADSDGLGPDNWDDVLSAWMTNAGVLTALQQVESTPASSKETR